MGRSGSILIELIMLIIICVILFIVAILKFEDFKRESELKMGHAITSALKGAINLLHARYLIKGKDYNVKDVLNSIYTLKVTLKAGIKKLPRPITILGGEGGSGPGIVFPIRPSPWPPGPGPGLPKPIPGPKPMRIKDWVINSNPFKWKDIYLGLQRA